MKKLRKLKPETQDFVEKADAALRQAVSDVIEEHRRLKMPLVVGQNGKVVYLSADKIPSVVREKRGKYMTKKEKDKK